VIGLRFGTAVAALAVLAAGAAHAAEAPKVTLYRHANLIDGTGGPMRPGVSVLVEGERIKAVGPDAALAAPAGAQVVDLAGKYLLPGLIDSHEHLATPPNRRAAEAHMRRDLYGGVTAIRDMADDLRAVAEAGAGNPAPGGSPGPRHLLRRPDGRPELLRRSADPCRDLRGDARPGALDEGHRRQDRHPRGGDPGQGHFGHGHQDLCEPAAGPREEDRREAHRQGMAVWTHSAIYPTTPAQVLDARPDVTSHTCYMAYQVVGTPPSYQDRYPIDPKPFVGRRQSGDGGPVRADEGARHDPRPDRAGLRRGTPNGSPRTPRAARPSAAWTWPSR